MGWVKLDDGFFRHRKVSDLSNDAKLLFVAGLCYAAEQLTDGKLSKRGFRIVAAVYADVPEETVKELVDVGLWHRDGDGYAIDSYLDFNPTAEQEQARRAASAERARRLRNRRNGVTRAVTNAATRAVTSGATNAASSLTPSPSPYPYPESGSSESEEPSSSSASGEEEDRSSPMTTGATLARACRLIADRRLERRTSTAPIVDRSKWLEKTVAERIAEHRPIALALLEERPAMTPDELADELEPDLRPAKPKTDRDPCPTCGDSTWIDDPDDRGAVIPCPDCSKETR